MKNLVKQSMAGLRVLLVFTVLLGVVYPLGVWLVSRLPGLQHHAEGSVVLRDGHAVGSELIGVDPVFPGRPTADPWFHNRPSAGAAGPLGPGDPAASGGSNRGSFDPELVAAVRERKRAVAAREGVRPDAVPADAVTASASGVDPAISGAYAELQVPRVARNNGLPEDRVRELVRRHTSGLGVGVPVVTVLPLNLAVQDAASG
ncbi:potassium-transporting ATPase subunit C [Amycolatopsis cihanbeyliensis]|uniref:Potassium-transporting ATPase KdpC subunit n=1 Tax=Amycolatopsis cihanbeyliensis TaxID=1128664 RepID=A0A542DGY9_AMYCI|nr:potassium-transporting ATPase subunit C [Amycolatopsis cihanbeyliensis]TQJ02358.1 K+-transporting ATPase ATPase C chain [Amycolatopsis cihanbeyliensis]